MPESPRPRLAGLDGLRALAVLLVVVYHLFPVLPGGFLGVDVFFVISGFLITTLLLREREDTGAIALGRFWARRARRLLPALALVVLASASAAWLVGGDVLVGLGRQLLGAAAFAYNWVALADGASYFTADQPELLRNLWSLAVEEQFYLLWPLLLPLLLRVRSRAGRVTIATALATASAVWGGMLVAGAGDVTRAYYGTDTHAYGLLLGVAVAFAASGRTTGDAPGPHRARWTGVVGLAAVAGIVALATLPSTDDARTFPGTLVAASVLAAIAIAAAVRPGSWLGPALDVAPLRWIGERSYGIYLWHWPLAVLATVAVTGLSPDVAVPPAVGAGVLALTLVLAALSHRFVEQPLRRHGFRGTWAGIERRLRGTPLRRFGAVAAVATVLALVGGTTAAVGDAPRMASSQAVVVAGAAALDAASDGAGAGRIPGAPIRPGAAPLAPQCASTHLSDEGGVCVAPDGRPSPPAAAPVAGSRVTAIGDSVMLASAGGLLERFPGIAVDAKVSRNMSAGPPLVADLAAAGALRDYVVVGLGTNGPVTRETLTELRGAVGRGRTLVLVDAVAPRDWIPGVNETLHAFARDVPGVVIAEWSTAIAPHADLLARDRIHPGTAGGVVYADAVASAIEDAENRHAQVRYQIELAQWALGRTFAGSAARD